MSCVSLSMILLILSKFYLFFLFFSSFDLNTYCIISFTAETSTSPLSFSNFSKVRLRLLRNTFPPVLVGGREQVI